MISVKVLPNRPSNGTRPTFVKGLPGVTDLVLSGTVALHNPTSHPHTLTHLTVHLAGLLSITMTDTRPTPAIEHRRLHHHMDVAAPIPVPPHLASLPPRTTTSVPFAMRLPASFKVYPSFRIAFGDVDPPTEDAGASASECDVIERSCLTDTVAAGAAESIEPGKARVVGPAVGGCVGALAASNAYKVTATVEVVPANVAAGTAAGATTGRRRVRGSAYAGFWSGWQDLALGLNGGCTIPTLLDAPETTSPSPTTPSPKPTPPVSLVSPPTLIPDGLFPIEPEAIQSIHAAPLVHATSHLRASFPATLRTGGRHHPLRVTFLPASLAACRARRVERIKVEVELVQKVAFDMKGVRGAVEGKVWSSVVEVEVPVGGAGDEGLTQTVGVDLPPLPPTTFANGFLNVSYTVRATAELVVPTNPICRMLGMSASGAVAAAVAPALLAKLSPITTDADAAGEGFPRGGRIEILPLTAVTVAPISKRTATRALVDAPWLLLPHQPAMGDVPVDAGAWEGVESAGREESSREMLVPIPAECYRPMRRDEGTEEALPRYEPRAEVMV
ncbi:hypothetical protein HDU96_009861 [Phlyctochytrium bullatum]|nr:hypothetical protein HDU96_009861 [Phlyctochytrium bullatum]